MKIKLIGILISLLFIFGCDTKTISDYPELSESELAVATCEEVGKSYENCNKKFGGCYKVYDAFIIAKCRE